MGILINEEDVKEILLGIDSLPWEEEVDDLVRGISTAYDVDAVVKQIEEFYPDAEHYGFSGAIADIIEIVRRGGMK